MRVLNFGSLNLDHTYIMDHFVQPGETAGALEFKVYFGGKGHNQSIALARAGVTTFHAGLIGTDGESIRQHMEENGIDTRYTGVAATPTGHAVIQVDKNGQNAIMVYAGANGCILPELVDKVLAAFSHRDTLVLQNEINNIPHIMKVAKERDIRIVFNPSPFVPEIMNYPLETVDVFVVNEIEGEALAGQRESDRICDELRRRYPAAEVLLTLGNRGAVFASGDERVYQPAYEAPVVDTTAAGDTFTGYFLAWHLGGSSPAEALRAATMASAIAVSRPGAAASIPRREEVLERLERIEKTDNTTEKNIGQK